MSVHYIWQEQMERQDNLFLWCSENRPISYLCNCMFENSLSNRSRNADKLFFFKDLKKSTRRVCCSRFHSARVDFLNLNIEVSIFQRSKVHGLFCNLLQSKNG